MTNDDGEQLEYIEVETQTEVPTGTVTDESAYTPDFVTLPKECGGHPSRRTVAGTL